MIIGNCSFERILGKYEKTPLIRLSFVSICHCESHLLTLAMQTAYNTPQHCGIRKRAPNEFWNFLTASPFAGLLLDFFKARFRFLLVRWSVGIEARRPGRSAEKVTFFESLETFLRLILICLLTVESKKKPFSTADGYILGHLTAALTVNTIETLLSVYSIRSTKNI